jgi:hypothetical protein
MTGDATGWAPIWLAPSWRAQALAWIDDRLARLGRRRMGEVQQPHVRPWSTVMAVPTDAGTCWFKASGPGTAYEAPLVQALAAWGTPMLLTPLAVDPERAWILLPDGGTRLRDAVNGTAGVDQWLQILPAYAALQRGLASRVDALLELGVPDLRPAAMPGHFSELVDDPTSGLAEPDRARLGARLPEYADWCAALGASGVGPTLQHDDLHDGNVFAGPAAGPFSGGGDRIFDWGDAVVAHPFGTLLATLRSVASRDPTLGRADLVRLRDAYLEPWTAEHSGHALIETVRMALRVGAVGRALAWKRALHGVPVEAQGDYAGMVGHWLLEPFEPTVI